MMAKPHKHAADGIDFETSLPIESVANMAQRAAAESTGDLERGRQRVVSVRSTDRTIEFRINDFLVSFNKLMIFTLTFTPQGGRTFGTTSIDWYLTTRTTVGGLIPIGSKAMVARHTFLQFVTNLAAQIGAADAEARITIREGSQTGAPGAGAPVAPAFPVPPVPAPAAPAPGAAVVPPPPPPAPSSVVPPPSATPVPPVRPSAAHPPLPPTAEPYEWAGIVTGIPGSMRQSSSPLPPSPLPGLDPQAAQLFADDGDLESTRLAQASGVPRAWSLRLPDGRVVPVASPVVFGREPTAPASHATARPVAVEDPMRSVSKTHAVVFARDGMLWVADLHSTNGTTVTNTAGEATSCPPGVAMPVGDGWTVSLAEFSLSSRLEG